MTKSNRKNKRSIILILILILSVAITGTFIGTIAKYVMTETVSDNAVSAKFGLKIPTSINLFSDSYGNVEADTDDKKIIAPGTSGQYTFSVTGTSEVAYQVDADISISYSDEWQGYEPLEFSINDEVWTDFARFKENLNEALGSKTMPPNTAYESVQTIYWRWPFYVSDLHDTRDTTIGRLSAGGTVLEVTVTIEVTAVQVD